MKPLIIALAALTIGAALPQAPASPLQGVWCNPKGTVKVQIAPCATELCGTVVTASPTALADASDEGYPALVGMRLLYDYRPTGPSAWQGMIFVPDIGRSFSSHIEMVDADHVRVSGCLLGRFVCKSQLWRRA